ncbi:MAG TPA: transposase [Puia sp.]|nr:transposase [Puia sp.]
MMTLSYHTEFLTATILDWKHLLKDDNCKQIIIDSLQWLVEQKRCSVQAFVIMPNHIHLLWKISDGIERFYAQGALLSFTAHAFKKYLMAADPTMLNKHYVNKIDRQYQFWQRESMVKECWSEKFFNQKMGYIHNNPCQ